MQRKRPAMMQAQRNSEEGRGYPDDCYGANSAGNPLPGASFNLKRGTALTALKLRTMLLQMILPSYLWNYWGNVNLVWGWDAGSSEDRGDGKATFEVSQNSSYGLSTPSAQNSCAIPRKASRWMSFSRDNQPGFAKSEILGPYAGNVSSSAGVTFKRPLLAAEATTGAR